MNLFSLVANSDSRQFVDGDEEIENSDCSRVEDEIFCHYNFQVK